MMPSHEKGVQPYSMKAVSRSGFMGRYEALFCRGGHSIPAIFFSIS